MSLPYAEQALRHLRRKDPALRPIFKQVGPFVLEPHGDRFQILARSIISQQISTKAAQSIAARVVALLGRRRFAAESVRKLSHEQLRSAGLSRAKAVYFHDLADWVGSGRINLHAIHQADDEEIIRELTQVKGIGRWTAEMFLIFCLGRPDVLPIDDLGLRAGVRRCDGLEEMPTKAEVRERGSIWAPYRTVATWYLWQSLKPPPA